MKSCPIRLLSYCIAPSVGPPRIDNSRCPGQMT